MGSFHIHEDSSLLRLGLVSPTFKANLIASFSLYTDLLFSWSLIQISAERASDALLALKLLLRLFSLCGLTTQVFPTPNVELSKAPV